MYDADIRGSIAYAKALTLVRILTKDEESKIIKGLIAVGKEWQSGQVLLTDLLLHCDLLIADPHAVSDSTG